jgi:hypothetical protein
VLCFYQFTLILLDLNRVKFKTTLTGAAFCVHLLETPSFSNFWVFWTSKSTMGNILAHNTRQDASNDAMLVDEPRSAVKHPRDLQDFPMSADGQLTGPNDLYELLPDGSRRASGGHREKQCQTCLKWIDLGNTESGEVALANHEGKKCCMATVHANKLEGERLAAAAAVDDLRRTASVSPRTPYQPGAQLLSSPYSLLSPLSFVSGRSSVM